MHDAGTHLLRTSTSVGHRRAGITKASTSAESGAGDARLAAALARFEAGYGQFVDDLAVELKALGTLATNAAADLATAGGEH